MAKADSEIHRGGPTTSNPRSSNIRDFFLMRLSDSRGDGLSLLSLKDELGI